MGILDRIKHGGPGYHERQKEKAEEKTYQTIVKKRVNQARRQGYAKGAAERARKEGYEQGKSGKKGSGISVLGGLAKMGEGVSFNTTNPVLFGGSSAPRKGKRRSSDDFPDPLSHLL